MRMKTSVILVEKSIACLMVMLVQLQSSRVFFHKFHSNVLPIEEVVYYSVVMEICKKKKDFCNQSFTTMGMT